MSDSLPNDVFNPGRWIGVAAMMIEDLNKYENYTQRKIRAGVASAACRLFEQILAGIDSVARHTAQDASRGLPAPYLTCLTAREFAKRLTYRSADMRSYMDEFDNVVGSDLRYFATFLSWNQIATEGEENSAYTRVAASRMRDFFRAFLNLAQRHRSNELHRMV